MQKWEYKILRSYYPYPGETVLNELGQDGWELVATTAPSYGGEFMFILKRPKS